MAAVSVKRPICNHSYPSRHFEKKFYLIVIDRRAVQEHYDFRRRCNSFFMELVSLFCFGAEAGTIDSELFSMFMSYVLQTTFKTKAFSPFPEHGIDATPVVRSFLLQQLLRTGYVENVFISFLLIMILMMMAIITNLIVRE